MKAASVRVSKLTEVTCQLCSAAVSKILCSTDRPGKEIRCESVFTSNYPHVNIIIRTWRDYIIDIKIFDDLDHFQFFIINTFVSYFSDFIQSTKNLRFHLKCLRKAQALILTANKTAIVSHLFLFNKQHVHQIYLYFLFHLASVCPVTSQSASPLPVLPC